MYRSNKLLLLLFIIISGQLCAQNDVLLGADYNPDKDTYLTSVIGGDNSGVYSLRQKTKGRNDALYIEKFSYPDFKKVFSKEISIKDIPGLFLMKEAYLEEFVIRTKFINKSIYVFLTSYGEHASLLCIRFNENGEQQGPPFEVAKTAGRVSGYFQVSFSIDYSPNEEYMLITTLYDPIVNPDKTNPFASLKDRDFLVTQNVDITLDVYKTADMSLVYNKSVKRYVKKTEDNSRFTNFQIDNNSNVTCAILYHTMEKKEMKITKMDIGIIRNLDASIKKLNIEMSDTAKSLISFRSISLENGNVVVFGYLGDETKKNKDKSDLQYFCKNVNATTLESKFAISGKFDEKIQTQLTYDIPGMTYMKWPGNKHFGIKGIVTLNGNFYVIASHVYSTNYNPISEKSFEIMVTKISNTGKIEWVRLLPRHSKAGMLASLYDRFGGFDYIVRNDNIQFLYLDNPTNITLVDPYNFNMLEVGVTSKISESSILNVKLDENGKISRKYVFSNATFGWKPNQKAMFINKNELLMFFKFEQTEKFGLYKFE